MSILHGSSLNWTHFSSANIASVMPIEAFAILLFTFEMLIGRRNGAHNIKRATHRRGTEEQRILSKKYCRRSRWILNRLNTMVNTDCKDIDQTPTGDEHEEHVRHLLDQGGFAPADSRILNNNEIRHRVRPVAMDAVRRRSNVDKDADVDQRRCISLVQVTDCITTMMTKG
jgi:hypothetical protein